MTPAERIYADVSKLNALLQVLVAWRAVEEVAVDPSRSRRERANALGLLLARQARWTAS